MFSVCFGFCWSQEKKLPLFNACMLMSESNVYVGGMEWYETKSVFKLMRLSPSLVALDSVSVVLGNTKPDLYLPISFDTLHGSLNYVIQKKESGNKVSVLRFDKKLKLLNGVTETDLTRVNSFTNFRQEQYVYKNTLYTIKTVADTSQHKQFYLSAYDLKDKNKAFDYVFRWQFALDRQFITNAHIFYADTQQVMLFVNVNDGTRKGQWLLRVNAQNGFLIRGTRLNTKTEKVVYQFSDFYRDSLTKDILLLGERRAEAVTNATLTANKVEAFVVKVDSLGNISSRSSQSINISVAKLGKSVLKTVVRNYRLRVLVNKKLASGELLLQAQVYEQLPGVWQYADSYPLIASPLGDDYLLDRQQFLIQPNLALYFWTNDKLNTNGLLVADSVNGNAGLYYRQTPTPFLKAFKAEDGTKTYLLQKVDTKKQSQTLSRFYFDGKAMQSQILYETPLLQPVKLVYSTTYFISMQQNVEGLILKYEKW